MARVVVVGKRQVPDPRLTDFSRGPQAQIKQLRKAHALLSTVEHVEFRWSSRVVC